MPLLSLPTEILRQIVQFSVPSTLAVSSYLERQATLCALCYVCRRLLSIAQPLLFEILFTPWPETLVKILDALDSKGWTNLIRQVGLQGQFMDPCETKLLARLTKNSPSLHTLALDNFFNSEVDLTILQSFSSLATLQLCGSGFTIPSKLFLPGIECLTFNQDAVRFAPSLLDPAVVPSLRTLGIVGGGDSDTLESLSRSRLEQLLPQIELLVLPCDFLESRPTYLTPFFDNAVFDRYPSTSDDLNPKLVEVQHLRILAVVKECAFSEYRGLPGLITAIKKQKPVRLRSICLDSSLQDTSTFTKRAATLIGRLVKACSEKGIEMVYEQQGRRSIELFISEELRRKRRETRGR